MWTKLFDNTVTFNVQTKVLPSKGNLAYEYNPFRNYRLSSNMYEYQGNLYSIGELYSQYGISISCKARRKKIGNVYEFEITSDGNFTELDHTCETTSDISEWISEIYKKGRTVDRMNFERALNKAKLIGAWKNVSTNTDPILREKGELVDFVTDELKISLDHPLHIIPQYSYDGSVNLIINDGINIPRLINSRFSATGKNTYEIVNRKGNNDTNIYDQGEQFDTDTSLYKRVSKIAKISLGGVYSGGNLSVGNYYFYFKLSDADGNETDFIGESGLVSIFVGQNQFQSVHTGQMNENSYKQVSFNFKNLDSSYDYLTVYYSRSTAEHQLNSVTEYVKINKKYLIQNPDTCNIVITGFEETTPVSLSDINLLYNVVDAVNTSAICQNMLFMANVHKPDLSYEELQDLSLRFLPYLKEENYDVQFDENYIINTKEKGYIDPLFIYNKTGYWGEEIYRLGIVYILPNGTLSPVFNIRGANKVTTYDPKGYSNKPVYNEEGKRVQISYNEQTNYILETDGTFTLENVKGVISLDPNLDTNTIYSLDIRVDDYTLQELKKYVKGYFFVRQQRIPSILTQAITIGVDQESRTPTIPVAGGVIEKYQDLFSNTHMDVDNAANVNYLSEGFLQRFNFAIKEKEAEGWKTALKIAAIAVAAVAAVAVTVVTAGVGGAAIAGAASVLSGAATVATATGGITAAAAAAITSSTVVTAAVVGGATIVGAGGYAAGDAIANKYAQKHNKVKLEGRNTVIPKGYKMVETNESRTLTDHFGKRFILKDPDKNKIQAMLCPDYVVNPAFYNSIFVGNEHVIKSTKTQSINTESGLVSNYFNNDERHFYISSYHDTDTFNITKSKILSVQEGVKAVGLENDIFRSKAGEAEEAFRYESIGQKYKDETMAINGDKKQKDDDKISLQKINSDIVRGIFGPYLAFSNSNDTIGPAEIVNIYVPDYSDNNITDYFQIRMQDNSQFFAISDRIDLNDLDSYLVESPTNLVTSIDRAKGYMFNVYRGDCYICQFTQRIIRNFNDPSAPYNDDIIDLNSWKDHYNPETPESFVDINLGDVNAVPLGMWVTFRLRSSSNLNIRTLDGSNISEAAASGHERGYFPYYPMVVDGSYKIPESQIHNKGFRKSVSDRWNMQAPDIPYNKNWFGTRIMYSDIHINDAFKNGFRVFKGQNYKDYTREYGEIVKLIPFESKLLVVFEHGIGVADVNERAVATQGAGGKVYINSANVLPDKLEIISDMFGSQWPESVLKVPGKSGNSVQWVYGVDTVAKKIWRTDGRTLQCISDMRVQEFLNNNITLGERELTPKIGIRNVKTVYNAFKQDVLFTFYDNTYGFEEKVWNLCWNEILEKFITFYSWVPSYMENINNIPFSFDRNVSKWIAKLGTSHAESSIADGVTLSNVLTNNKTTYNDDKFIAVDDFSFNYTYLNKEGMEITKTYFVDEADRHNYIGVLSLSNRVLPNDKLFYQIIYTLERDNYLNYKSFEIVPIKVQGETGTYKYDTGKVDSEGNSIIQTCNNCITLPSDAMYAGQSVLTFALKFKGVEGTNSEAYFEVYYQDPTDSSFKLVYDGNDINAHNVYTKENIYCVESLLTELYYRNSAGNAYADYDHHKIGPEYLTQYISNDVLWFKDEYTLEKIIQEYGEFNQDLKIGNSLCLSTSDDKYYCYKDENGKHIISDKAGDAITEIPSNLVNEITEFAPETRLIFDSQDAYTQYVQENPDERSYLHKWDQGTMLGKYVVWNPRWKEWSLQATPSGTPWPCTTLGEIKKLITYRTINGKEIPYVHGIPLAWHWTVPEEGIIKTDKVYYDLPIFKDITGKRKMLPKDLQLNPEKIVTLLNIRANITLVDTVNEKSLSDNYYNLKTSLIDNGYYESTVAITPKWNMQFLGSDFWKHGQAGIIDIADDIYPTHWYGKQHPFEFECVVVNDPSVHKIFTNLELVANKAKPESFHYEIIGEAYDFAKDKPNMYFRQEALKALWQYNGADITYNRNFLKVQPSQQKKSADLPHKYYTRQDTINEIEDYYKTITLPFGSGYSYDHLSGAEIVYYPNRKEYRIWQHTPAVDLNELDQDDARSIIRANCQYLEDKWRISINPILICYKNETWIDPNRPKLPVMNSPIPDKAYRSILNKSGEVEIPDVLYNLGYSDKDMDTQNWLDSDNIYGTSFGLAQNRKEIDLRDKFIKVRIRYLGDELAIIDFLNTIYRVSYA